MKDPGFAVIIDHIGLLSDLKALPNRNTIYVRFCLPNPKATESNVLLPRALCRDDDTPSMDGLASDVTSSWLRYSFEDLFSKATMYKTRRPRLPASSEINFPFHREEVPCCTVGSRTPQSCSRDNDYLCRSSRALSSTLRSSLHHRQR